METASERRKRKLRQLVDEHGLIEVGQRSGLSPVALEQILKGVKLPPKADGTQSERSLGDKAARAIEAGLDLGEGWFDAPEGAAPYTKGALAIAAAFDKMTPTEKQRLLYALRGVADNPDTNPGKFVGGMDTGFGDLPSDEDVNP
jgi:hypothetical protein